LRALTGGIEARLSPFLGLTALVAITALGAYATRRGRASGLRAAAINDLPGRAPWASRYMHVGAVFLFLVFANLLEGVTIRRRALLVTGAVASIAAGLNLMPLFEGQERFEREAVLTRADLAAIEIARRTIDPEFVLTPEIAGPTSLIDVRAGPYLKAVDEHGSPAYTPAELAAAPESGRRWADIVLAHALPISLEVVESSRAERLRRGRCEAVTGASFPAASLAPGTTWIDAAPGPPVSLALRRFARSEFPVPLETVSGGSVSALRIPPDALIARWRLRAVAEQPIRICRPATAPPRFAARRD
jgi:hypothetical protein